MKSTHEAIPSDIKLFAALSASLTAILTIRNMSLDSHIKNRALGDAITKTIIHLPNYVTSVKVNDDLIVSRHVLEIQKIEEKHRQTWTLARIDEYAASVAKSIHQPWISKFKE